MIISVDVYQKNGPNIQSISCNHQDNQQWIWNTTDGTLKSKYSGKCLTAEENLEIWAAPLTGGSQAVVLFNRGDGDSAQLTVKWTDIGFPSDHSATVRDLWAHKDLGVFTGSFSSSDIGPRSVMMLNITLTNYSAFSN
jgi:hypothetical protein